ncbi:hypothetical protein Tco_1536488, partial [Tanacetum coccineum]
MYTVSLKRSENYKAQPYQYASSSKQILKEKAKPFPPCTHYGFNDHRPDDCRNYPYAIHVEALYTPPLTIMNLITLKERHIRGPNWYLDSGCSRSMTGVKSYLHKYVEQLGPKVVFGDNSSCITEGYGSINYEGITFTKVAFVNGVNTWMNFGGNARDWAHMEKKRTRLRLYTKSFEEIMHTERGDGVANPKRRRQDFQDDGVRYLATASERSRLKKALKEST